jgi:hypothetical protein
VVALQSLAEDIRQGTGLDCRLSVKPKNIDSIVGQAWMERPFVQHTFTVSLPTEIAIIRKHHLTKLYYDLDRSHADIVAAMHNPSLPVREFKINGETLQDAEADKQATLKEKHRQIQTVLEHRRAIEINTRSYTDATNEVGHAGDG